MEAGGSAAKQLKCYGRRNRSKIPKEERAAAPRSNGKVQDESRLRLAEEETGQDRGQGLVACPPKLAESSSFVQVVREEPVAPEKVEGGSPSQVQENAREGTSICSELGLDEQRQGEEQIPNPTEAVLKPQEACVEATEVLDEPVVSAPETEAVVFRTEEEQLEYEELILCHADDISTRREALEAVKKRIPQKWKEPTHGKCHWDYVLEEMAWLAKDFDKERKWKLKEAKKVAYKVAKARSELELKGLRRQKGEAQRIRRIASNIAKEVKKFWSKIEKLLVYKHQLAVEERKKKALDKHLDFLLGQTERYSSMLAENLSRPDTESSEREDDESLDEPESSSDQQLGDDEFVCDQEEEDDEATVEADEALITEEERKQELDALNRESELSVDELVKRYAAGEDGASENSGMDNDGDTDDGGTDDADEDEQNSSGSEEHEVHQMDDGEYDPNAVEEEDDEGTFIEEETLAMTEGNDSKSELELLRLEGELPVSELLSRYQEHSETEQGKTMDSEPGCSDSQGSREMDLAAEARERMGQPSTSGRNTFLILRSRSGEKGKESSDLEAEVLANVARAAKQRGERIKRREKREEGCSLNSQVEDSGKRSGQELEDAAAAAQSAQPTGYTFSTTKVRTKPPFLLKHSLREYQHIGLDWLVTMYEKRLNGILADEMGLGKTIMTIALLAHLACEKGIWGPHLIVVPTSVMLNWETEIMKWCPAFKVLTYFGNARERKIKRQGWSKVNTFHVCITTYRLVIQDAKAFKRKKWKYLILDEAHLIKNWKSQRWQMLLNFNSKRRILLTGTPLQNDLMELWSLMHFLMPHVFQSHQEFKDWFSNPITGMIEGQEKVNQTVVDRLHNVLRPFLLRRLKRDVEKQLPQKYEHVVNCRLSKRQRNLYEDFMASSDTQATLSSGNFLGLINVLMQLRKVCNHPDLFEARPIISSFDMPAIELQFPSAVCGVVRNRQLVKEMLCLLLADHEYRMESWEPDEVEELAEPGPLIEEIASTGDDNWNDFEQPQGIFEEIQAVLYNQKKLAQRRERAKRYAWLNLLRCSKTVLYGCGFRRQVTVEHPVHDIHKVHLDPSRFLECSSVLADMIKLPTTLCNNLMDLLKAFVFVIPAARSPSPVIWCSYHQSYGSMLTPSIPGGCLMEVSNMLAPLRPITVRRQLFFPDRRLLQFDCGKLQELEILLRRLKSEGHRALIFTQMTKMLDILESFINLYGYTYMRLDGSTKPEQRQILMQRFNTNPKIFLFILSTRSGGVGINLVGADTVIFYDSDWNPAMDQQAQDRCHRIGQTREVHIYRLVSESTIEENILKKANQKRFLDDLVIQSGSYNTEFFKKLDPMELLSGVGAHQKRAEPTVSSADVEAALRQAEDEADYMAMKQVEQEEAADIQEFTDDVSVEEDECADDADEGKAVEAGKGGKPHVPEPQTSAPAHEEDIQKALGPGDAEEDMDMLADVKQMVAAAAASGQGKSYFDQLKPIEKYAVQFLDLWDPIIDAAALETQVAYEEKEWELEQLEKIKEQQDAEADEEEEPLAYESWDASLADAAYRQQVEILTQQQEMLQAELGAAVDDEMEDADRDIDKSSKAVKKKNLKSIGGNSPAGHVVPQQDPATPRDSCEAASEEADYDMQCEWTPFQRKRKAPSFWEEDMEEEDSRLDFASTSSKPRELSIAITTKPHLILDRKKESLRLTPADKWASPEDAVLCAVVHEYGANWRLASDTLEGVPDGSRYRGRQRHPLRCRDRFRQLVLENLPGHDKTNQLKLSEEDTKGLLEQVQRIPDNEFLLQRHFVAVLRAKGYKLQPSTNRNNSSTSGEPQGLPFVSQQTLFTSSGAEAMMMTKLHGAAAVAEALLQSSKPDAEEISSPRKKSYACGDEEYGYMELVLSFPNSADIEELAMPITVAIDDRPACPKPMPVETNSALRPFATILAEDRFRMAAQMGLEGVKAAVTAAAAEVATGSAAAMVPAVPKNVQTSKKRLASDTSVVKLPKAKQAKLQNGTVESSGPGTATAANVTKNATSTVTTVAHVSSPRVITTNVKKNSNAAATVGSAKMVVRQSPVVAAATAVAAAATSVAAPSNAVPKSSLVSQQLQRPQQPMIQLQPPQPQQRVNRPQQNMNQLQRPQQHQNNQRQQLNQLQQQQQQQLNQLRQQQQQQQQQQLSQLLQQQQQQAQARLMKPAFVPKGPPQYHIVPRFYPVPGMIRPQQQQQQQQPQQQQQQLLRHPRPPQQQQHLRAPFQQQQQPQHQPRPDLAFRNHGQQLNGSNKS